MCPVCFLNYGSNGLTLSTERFDDMGYATLKDLQFSSCSLICTQSGFYLLSFESLCCSFEEVGILYLKLDAIIMAIHHSLVQERALVRAVPKPAFKTALSD